MKIKFLVLFLLILVSNGLVYSITDFLDFSRTGPPLPPQPPAGCRTEGGGNVSFFTCLLYYFNSVLRLLVFVSVSLAVIFVVISGIYYIVYGSKKEKIEIARKILFWTSIGFIIAIGSYAFVRLLYNLVQSGPGGFFDGFDKYVFAQTDRNALFNATIESSLVCDGAIIPSVLERNQAIDKDAWKKCIAYYSKRFLSFFYVLSLMLGIIFLTSAGILYMSHSKDVAEIHKRIKWGVIGLLVSMMSYIIVKVIGLFFEVNL